MNIRVLFADFLLAEMLSVSAQEYLLPIGSNVNRRELTGAVFIGRAGTDQGVVDNFTYTPAMGDFETIARARLKALADKFYPPEGKEQDDYVLGISFQPQPYTDLIPFKLQKSGDRWIIPPEALEVDLQYGDVFVWTSTVTDVEMEVRGEERTNLFSTITGTGGTVCQINSTVYGPRISLSREYTVPKYREPWVTEGEVTLYESGLWARFNILNGWLIETSPEPPAFLAELRVEPIPPRITGVRRIEDTTEITVESETAVILEFSENTTDWSEVSYPTLTTQSVGSRTLSHQSSSASGFYRVRLAETPTQK